MDNDNIIKCYDVYEDRNYVHFVFDIVEGGDLFDYIISNDDHHLNEMNAAQLFSQIMDAIHYLNQQNIIHRDIKLENLLIMQGDANLKIKLIDFGFAVKIDKITEKLGSLNYMAPEIHLDKGYDSKVDMWAVGIILYNMLSGKQPFSGDNEKILVNKVINEEINFNYGCWSTIGNDCKNLIKILLSKNPQERPTAFEAKNHSWILTRTKNYNDPTVAYKFNPKPELLGDIIVSLKTFSNLKNDLFRILLKYFDINEAENCKVKIDFDKN